MDAFKVQLSKFALKMEQTNIAVTKLKSRLALYIQQAKTAQYLVRFSTQKQEILEKARLQFEMKKMQFEAQVKLQEDYL